MGANRLEKFTTQIVNRQTIHEADYNPRRITEASAKKLRKFLREHGLWQPLIVNKQTMTLVSGHQRLAAMDTLLRKPDYDLTVALVDVDEETEIKGNVFMNNPSAQGEWDVIKLEGIKDVFPNIDFTTDLGFDQSEVFFMFGDDCTSKENEEGESNNGAADKATINHTAEDYRAIKEKSREKAKQDNEAGVGYLINEADYQVTIVFPNNLEKRRFMEKIKKNPKEKYIKHTVLYDIENHIYKVSEVSE